MREKLGIVRYVLATLLVIVCCNPSEAQQPGPPLGIAGNTNDASLQGKLQQHVAQYALTASNFPDALIRVAGQFEIPMGIAWVRSPASNAPIDLSWKDATVQQILSTIAKTQPG